ncbi:MAG TPA: D-alanine--D-alanine ligase, partial [Tepidisphaeraceae bacterium]|nr:D-alanine--D-alanine ligase [Tepidisphaeraceae bacterium]
VSLVSGKAVIEGLQSMGHEVFASDVSPEDLSGLDRPADVIFPVLHGQFGESGELQEILEQRRLPFVGSGSAASRLGMNKANTKVTWENAGLPTPKWLYVNADTADPSTGSVEGLFAPCVVKAVDSGSSIDVFICRTTDQARDAVKKVVSKNGRALVEQFIKGTELTVGILEEKPLAPIRIKAPEGFYDYEAKYKGQQTEYHFDLGVPADVVEKVRELGRKAHEVVGCRDLSRVDVMLDEQHRPYLLEINTLPGFTPRSLLPKAAKQAGIEFGPLVDRLVKRAYARGAK